MVGLNLETQCHGKQHGPEDSFGKPVLPACSSFLFFSQGCKGASVGEYHSCQHPWHEGDCLHLGVVPHLDNLQIV